MCSLNRDRILLPINICSIISGCIATAFAFASFFTSSWLVATSPTQNFEDGNIFRAYGLWDNGLSNLNCDVTPFSICMYTRGGILASMVVIIPALISSVVSVSIVGSGGRISTSGTFARASGIFYSLSAIGMFVGVLLYTIQHTKCIVYCPEKWTYYSDKMNGLKFSYSFYLAWVAFIFMLMALILTFVYGGLASKYKSGTSLFPEKEKKTKPEPITIENPNRV